MKEVSKKIIGLVCAVAIAISSMVAITPPTTVNAAASDIVITDAVKKFSNVPEYEYNYAWFWEASSEYKYMIITYTGDITNLRIQGVNKGKRLGEILWINQEHILRLELVGDNPVFQSKNGAVIVIDLKASGIDPGKIEGIDMHYGPGTLNIGHARLSTSSKIKKSVDIMPKVSAPKRATIKSASKAKGSADVKLSIKKVKGAYAYKVQFSTTKNFKKVIAKKIVKKNVVVITDNVLKKKKTLYVRTKAYKYNVKKKVYAKKWSKVKKVRIK